MRNYYNFFFLPIEKQRELYYKEESGNVTLADLKPIKLPKKGRSRRKIPFSHDLDDLNEAPTRRLLWHSVPADFDYFTYWHKSYFGKQDYVDKMIAEQDYEKVKKERLMNINLQFLIHARYKIGFALKTRAKLRDNSLYIMGYIMAKIIRFQFMQQNLAYLAHAQWQDETSRNFRLLLRSYEEMVRINVDIKDLIDYLKDVSDDYENYCHLDPNAKCMWNGDTTKPTAVSKPTISSPKN